STRQDRTECTLARRLPVPAALRGVLRPRTRHELPALVTSVLAVDHRLVLVALPLGRDSTRCRAAAARSVARRLAGLSSAACRATLCVGLTTRRLSEKQRACSRKNSVQVGLRL